MKDKNQNPFEIDFDSYILQTEPEQQENGKLWQTAIGLQQEYSVIIIFQNMNVCWMESRFFMQMQI